MQSSVSALVAPHPEESFWATQPLSRRRAPSKVLISSSDTCCEMRQLKHILAVPRGEAKELYKSLFKSPCARKLADQGWLSLFSQSKCWWFHTAFFSWGTLLLPLFDTKCTWTKNTRFQTSKLQRTKANTNSTRTFMTDTNCITQKDQKKSTSEVRLSYCRGDACHVVFVANGETPNITKH
jgi:spermidine synthase